MAYGAEQMLDVLTIAYRLPVALSEAKLKFLCLVQICQLLSILEKFKFSTCGFLYFLHRTVHFRSPNVWQFLLTASDSPRHPLGTLEFNSEQTPSGDCVGSHGLKAQSYKTAPPPTPEVNHKPKVGSPVLFTDS